ncbi:MAG: HEAT repeat domain-containing protein [Gemmataceae bacterium]
MRRLLTLCFLLIGTRADAGEKADLKSLIDGLKASKEESRLDALRALAELGPRAAPALEAVLALFDDASVDVRFVSAEAAGRMGKASVSRLAKLLAAKSGEVRYLAALALSFAKGEAEPAAPALMRALEDDQADVRYKAAYALGRMAPRGEKAIPALGRCLADKDDNLSGQALESLLRFEDRALGEVTPALRHPEARVRAKGLLLLAHRLTANEKAARPHVTAALKSEHKDVVVGVLARLEHFRHWPAMDIAALLAHKEAEVRRHAISLLLVHEDPAPARPALEAALANSDEFVAAVAARCFRERLGTEVWPMIDKAMARPEPEVRLYAARFLVQRNPEAASGLAALTRLVKEEAGPVRGKAAIFLGQTKGIAAKPAIPVLVEELKSKNPEAVRLALFTLYYIVPFDPDAALPGVAALVKHPHAGVRQATALCLSRFEKRAWPFILEMAKDEDAEVRNVLYSAVGENVRDTPDLLPFLQKAACDDPSEHGRRGAIWSLNWFSAKTVAPFLLERYKVEKSDKVREGIVDVARRWEATATPALDLYIAGLKDGVPRIRYLAAQGLRVLGPAARPAAAALKAAAKDGDPEVREAVTAALAAIGG